MHKRINWLYIIGAKKNQVSSQNKPVKLYSLKAAFNVLKEFNIPIAAVPRKILSQVEKWEVNKEDIFKLPLMEDGGKL